MEQSDSEKAWYDAIDEANSLINDDIEVDIQGYDIDGDVVRAARENAKEAGVDHLIHFQERAVKDLRHPKNMDSLSQTRRTESVWRKKRTFQDYIKSLVTASATWTAGRHI